jgi:hypothetical protein
MKITDNGERMEPNPCGKCSHFAPDDRDATDGERWGLCRKHKMSVTAKMQIVLRHDQPRCFKLKFVPVYAR